MDADCTGELICAAGVCVGVCETTADCTGDLICVGDICVLGCDSGADCTDGLLCIGDICVLGEDCVTNEDCEDDLIPLCLLGVCVGI